MKILYQFIVLATTVAIWQAFSGDILPTPKEGVAALYEIYQNGSLKEGVTDSMFRYVCGLLAGCASATIVGLIFGLYPKLSSAFEPLLGLLRPISPIAWIPLVVLAFGIGDKPTVFIISYAIFFPVLLLTVTAVRAVPNELILAAKGFGASKTRIITGVILPSSLFNIISGLKIAASLAWINLVVGEMVGAQSGLGYLIIDARNQLRIDTVLAVIFVIGVIGILINFIFSTVEKWSAQRLGK